jgi:hypothetical protein
MANSTSCAARKLQSKPSKEISEAVIQRILQFSRSLEINESKNLGNIVLISN